MFKLIFSLVILGIPISIQAGDCFTHPVVIHEIVVNSCEMLSTKNASSISQVASPATIASRYRGAILSGNEKRRREIEVDHPSMPNPTPMKWKKVNKPIKVLFVGDDENLCSRFPKGDKRTVAYFTNCECDTGAHPDGYCALTVSEVNEVPKEFEQYAR